MAIPIEMRFRSGFEKYAKDPVAQAAIRSLQEVMLHEGAANHSYWDGLHYTKTGEVELVQVYLGDETITVRKETDVPKPLFDRLAQMGRVIFEAEPQPAETNG